MCSIEDQHQIFSPPQAAKKLRCEVAVRRRPQAGAVLARDSSSPRAASTCSIEDQHQIFSPPQAAKKLRCEVAVRRRPQAGAVLARDSSSPRAASGERERCGVGHGRRRLCGGGPEMAKVPCCRGQAVQKAWKLVGSAMLASPAGLPVELPEVCMHNSGGVNSHLQ